ncbi:MAG: helical backbone metal receptor [Pseudomonadota bacterium]
MSDAATVTVRDQTGYAVTVATAPQRLVSLVPSQSELLWDLGVRERLVGCTRYCVHPDELRDTCTVIGGSKRFNIDAIMALQPDLVLANKEENERVAIERLRELVPTWTSDIVTFRDAMAMISAVGHLCGAADAAAALNARIERDWQALPTAGGERVAYLIWRKPYMAVATDTFIDGVLARLGFRNVFADRGRYPETSLDELARLAPQRVYLSSEPYPFDERHIAEVQAALPECRIDLVDGEMFSWYGSRLALAPRYFQRLLAADGAALEEAL